MKHPNVSIPLGPQKMHCPKDRSYYWIGNALILGLLSLCICLTSCSEILSPDISRTSLTMNSPSDSLYTSATTISFWWESVATIEKYELRITTNTAGNTTLLADTSLLYNSISYMIEDEGLYQWQVRGVNEGSTTNWQNGTIFIDNTVPNKAIALGLSNDTIPSGANYTLAWLSSDVPLVGFAFPVSDSLVLYLKNDSTTIGARYYFAKNAPKSLQISAFSPSPMNGPGDYYWKVITMDCAGNRRESNQFHFVKL